MQVWGEYNIPKELSREFCKTWARKWRNMAIFAFFMIGVEFYILYTAPPSVFISILVALVSIMLGLLGIDAMRKFNAYRNRARELGRKEIWGW